MWPQTWLIDECLNDFKCIIESQGNKCRVYFVPQKERCKKKISGPEFQSCRDRIDIISFVEACMMDLCYCGNSSVSCLCSTMSEYSRQCAHAGGQPEIWKNQQICSENTNNNWVFSDYISVFSLTVIFYFSRKTMSLQHGVSAVWEPLQRHLPLPSQQWNVCGALHRWMLLSWW